MKCTEKFVRTYKKEPDGVTFCPYRICPLGAHSDHQHGKVTGFAIDKGISIAYRAKENGDVDVVSMQFGDNCEHFNVNRIPEFPQGNWADYLRGAVFSLGRKYPLEKGVSAVIDGSLPIGGLSSSAAVIIAFLSALCIVNNIYISEHELVMTALSAENDYVGVACGKLDQSCEIYSKKNHMLYLDTKDDTYELISQNPNMKPYEIAIFFSGVERTLAGSAFNMRVDECRSSAYALKAYANMEYGKFSQTYLRDVPYEVYEKYAHKLPDSWRMRAEHWYSEYRRVEEGVEAWRNGDIEKYGKLSFESGRSSIENWQTGSPELKEIYEIMLRTDGIYGGRFSGAGFKGCCMALVDPEYKEEIEKNVTEKYLKLFPQYKDKFSVHFCNSADGCKIRRK
ncbi:MAG: GHMP kinase [Clostridia bacterium]|nr:GHMP kinase [Clostridia bacterium]